jgi:hypothetical protein
VRKRIAYPEAWERSHRHVWDRGAKAPYSRKTEKMPGTGTLAARFSFDNRRSTPERPQRQPASITRKPRPDNLRSGAFVLSFRSRWLVVRVAAEDTPRRRDSKSLAREQPNNYVPSRSTKLQLRAIKLLRS